MPSPLLTLISHQICFYLYIYIIIYVQKISTHTTHEPKLHHVLLVSLCQKWQKSIIILCFTRTEILFNRKHQHELKMKQKLIFVLFVFIFSFVISSASHRNDQVESVLGIAFHSFTLICLYLLDELNLVIFVQLFDSYDLCD